MCTHLLHIAPRSHVAALPSYSHLNLLEKASNGAIRWVLCSHMHCTPHTAAECTSCCERQDVAKQGVADEGLPLRSCD
jgi:hypothetical protein